MLTQEETLPSTFDAPHPSSVNSSPMKGDLHLDYNNIYSESESTANTTKLNEQEEHVHNHHQSHGNSSDIANVEFVPPSEGTPAALALAGKLINLSPFFFPHFIFPLLKF